MRTISISDIHGCYDEFRELLRVVDYNPTSDKLYLLGDYVDRGSKSKEVVQYVCKLSKNPNVKAIGGNHDDMFLAWLDDRDYKLSPYTNDKNGGTATILSFYPSYIADENDDEARKWIKEQYPNEIEFLRNLALYIEDENHIFVHAGINPANVDWKECTKKEFRWIRKPFYGETHKLDQTVVFGHTSTFVIREELDNFDVWFSDKKIGIDGGAKFGGQLNALIISSGEYSTYSVKVD